MTKRGQERRKRKRIPFSKNVVMMGIGTGRGSTISTGGMYIETATPLPEGSTVLLQFRLKDEDENPITVQALVMYIHDGVGMGVAFTDLPPEEQVRIERLIK
jgi:Tfp pilus assembly protein PilZ